MATECSRFGRQEDRRSPGAGEGGPCSLIAISTQPGWKEGRYELVAATDLATAEWDALVERDNEAAKAAFERLGAEPLTRQPTLQFQLRGETNRGFWRL